MALVGGLVFGKLAFPWGTYFLVGPDAAHTTWVPLNGPERAAQARELERASAFRQRVLCVTTDIGGWLHDLLVVHADPATSFVHRGRVELVGLLDGGMVWLWIGQRLLLAKYRGPDQWQVDRALDLIAAANAQETMVEVRYFDGNKLDPSSFLPDGPRDGYGVADERYALSSHTHPDQRIDIEALDARYALKAHDHDTAYSKLGHDHDTTYSKLGHDHDTTYSKLGHDHASSYAPLVHTHDHDLLTGYSPARHRACIIDAHDLAASGAMMRSLDLTTFSALAGAISPATSVAALTSRRATHVFRATVFPTPNPLPTQAPTKPLWVAASAPYDAAGIATWSLRFIDPVTMLEYVRAGPEVVRVELVTTYDP